MAVNETQLLRMTFLTAGDTRASISIRDCVDNPSSEVVEALMDHIIDKDIFNTSGGSLVEKLEANVIKNETTLVEDYTVEEE